MTADLGARVAAPAGARASSRVQSRRSPIQRSSRRTLVEMPRNLVAVAVAPGVELPKADQLQKVPNGSGFEDLDSASSFGDSFQLLRFGGVLPEPVRLSRAVVVG